MEELTDGEYRDALVGTVNDFLADVERRNSEVIDNEPLEDLAAIFENVSVAVNGEDPLWFDVEADVHGCDILALNHAMFVQVPMRLKDGNVVLTAVDKDVERTAEFTSVGGETEGEVCVFIESYARVIGTDNKIVRMSYVESSVAEDPQWDEPF